MLVWQRSSGPDIGCQTEHKCDSLTNSFVVRADTGTLKDQTEAAPAWPWQGGQSGFKVQPRDGRHASTLGNLIDLCSKYTQVIGNTIGGKIRGAQGHRIETYLKGLAPQLLP